jgi:chloramphenicol-sensitive protein RarD
LNDTSISTSRQGALSALAAYFIWGMFPLYFKALAAVPSPEVLANRISWGVVSTVALVLITGKAEALADVFRDRKRLLGLTGSAVCITINWGVYIWSVANHHALDASIGYYVLPLVSLVLAALFFHERLNRRQMVSVLLVLVGVGVLASGLQGVPWIVIILSLSFGGYGMLRKMVPVDALVGLTVETLLLCPFAIGYLLTRDGGGSLLAGGWTSFLLVAAGPVTALPLVMFAYGARRLKLSTLGLMQYINPGIQMVIAVLLFGEPFTRTHAITFAFIWGGLLLYSVPIKRRNG